MLKKFLKTCAYSSAGRKVLLPFVAWSHQRSYRMISGILLAESPMGEHPKHQIMDYHQWFCSKLEADWTVVDIGCGGGELARDLAAVCSHVTAIDISRNNITKAKAHTSAGNISYVHGDAFDVPLPEVDAVVLSNVLEHIKNRATLLSKIRKSTSRLLIRVPMIDRDWLPIYLKGVGLPWKLDDTHELEYTEDILEKELAQAGFYIENIRIRYGEAYAVAVVKN